jgi:tRNA G10  N-methylase Trm11
LTFEQARRASFGMSYKLRVLDPFAGIGKIHDLAGEGITTVGVELEAEWAMQHPGTEVGDALNLRFRRNGFDVIATSPCYGNRMADHHNAQDGSHRRSYKHYLDRDPSPGSASVMHWGDAYREFHTNAVIECDRVLRPGGLVLWNISNHKKTINKGQPAVEQKVSEWYMALFLGMGWLLQEIRPIKTPRYKYGENSETRTEFEFIIAMRKGF